LPTTGRRLGVSGGFHCLSRGVQTFKFALPFLRASAAVAPNRMLAAGIFPELSPFSLRFKYLCDTFFFTVQCEDMFLMF
jgi:hypothetical protein